MGKCIAGEEIGRRIRRRLEELHMTQVELARRLNVTPKLVSQYVTGTSIPPIDRIAEIAEELDCSIDELLGLSKKDSDRNTALKMVIEYCRELMK